MAEQNEVCDIGTVEAITRLDEYFRSNEIGDRRNAYIVIEHFRRLGILEPVIGNRRDKIRRAEYEVDVPLSLEDFRDPALVENLRLISQRSELVQNFRIIAGLAKNVDVFGRTPQSRVRVHGKSASH